MNATMRAHFRITLWYFKPSGKFYTDGHFEREFRDCGRPGLPSCHMPDVCAYVRGLRQSGGQGAMPGLSELSEGWSGTILVNCEQGYPCLILP